MICLVSFLHFAATGEVLECENCPKWDDCMEQSEEEPEEEKDEGHKN